MAYILSQIFVCISYSFLGLTYIVKNRKALLWLGLIAILFNGVSYLLLKAWMGAALLVVAIARNFLFLYEQKIKSDQTRKIYDRVVITALVIASTIIAIFTYNTWLSLFVFVGSVIYTISVCLPSVKVYKILGVFSSMCYIIYNAFIGSLFGIILEACLFVVSLVAVIMFFVKESKAKNNIKQNSEVAN